MAPSGRRVEPEEDERLPGPPEDTEDGEADEEPGQTSLFPSSIGLTFPSRAVASGSG